MDELFPIKAALLDPWFSGFGAAAVLAVTSPNACPALPWGGGLLLEPPCSSCRCCVRSVVP